MGKGGKKQINSCFNQMIVDLVRRKVWSAPPIRPYSLSGSYTSVRKELIQESETLHGLHQYIDNSTTLLSYNSPGASNPSVPHMSIQKAYLSLS